MCKFPSNPNHSIYCLDININIIQVLKVRLSETSAVFPFRKCAQLP